MKLHEAIGLELERREKVMDDCEKAHRAWAKSLPPTSINRTYGDVWKAAWDYQQARINALTAEVEEQARLLGASGSREAELLARIEALEKAARALHNRIISLSRDYDADDCHIINEAIVIDIMLLGGEESDLAALLQEGE